VSYDPAPEALRKAFYELLDKEYGEEIADAVKSVERRLDSVTNRLNEALRRDDKMFQKVNDLLDEAEMRRRREDMILDRMESLLKHIEAEDRFGQIMAKLEEPDAK